MSEEVKHLTLLWLGNCLASNAGRGKMWTSQMGPLLGATLASDGFMLNLGAVLLRFCKPLAADPAKMDKVDATYPAKVTAATEDRSLLPAPCSLHPAPCSLLPAPFSPLALPPSSL